MEKNDALGMAGTSALIYQKRPPELPDNIAERASRGRLARSRTLVNLLIRTRGLPAMATDRSAGDLATSMANIRMMHLLQRIALRFNQAGIPLMALKGAALNLTVYDEPDQRPMQDLDLLIRPEQIDAACALLEKLGCLRGPCLVREDFFPRFHYEVEYVAGGIHRVKIDLHVRPFRPLRYAQLVPKDALWRRALPVAFGPATILIPSAEDMLIHLAAHAAIHGSTRLLWLRDIKRWADARRTEIDWDRFLATVADWNLALPVRRAIERVEERVGEVCPPEIMQGLRRLRAGWRDRLALLQAPRDSDHPAAHTIIDALCTPGWRFVLGYLRAVVVPDRGHMAEWYPYRHRGWLPWAHVLRWLGPITRCLPNVRAWFTKIETRKSPIHGLGVFAASEFRPGELIARYRGRPVDRDGTYVVPHATAPGERRRVEITGKLRFLNHCCRPNAVLSGFELKALRRIRSGEEITIDYGPEACTCRRQDSPETHVTQHSAAEAA